MIYSLKICIRVELLMTPYNREYISLTTYRPTPTDDLLERFPVASGNEPYTVEVTLPHQWCRTVLKELDSNEQPPKC